MTSIILSDSDSDMEVAPLADRIGFTRDESKGRVKAAGRDPTNRDVPQSLTPSQAAGLAALKRLHGSNMSSRQGLSSPPPVLDLTVDGSGGDVLREEIRLPQTHLPVRSASKSCKYTSEKVNSSTEESSHHTLCDLMSTGDAGIGSTSTAGTEYGRKRKGDYSSHSSGNKHPARSGDPKLAASDGQSHVRDLASSVKPVRITEQTPSLLNTAEGRSDGGGSSLRPSSAIGGSLTQSAVEISTTSKG